MKPKILQMGADNFGAGGRSVIAYNMTRPLTNDFQVYFLAIGKLKNPSFHRIIEENGGHVHHVKEVSSKIKRLRSIYSILKKEKYDIVHISVDDAIEGLFNIILSKLSGAKRLFVKSCGKIVFHYKAALCQIVWENSFPLYYRRQQ